jgi:hypothetical protein
VPQFYNGSVKADFEKLNNILQDYEINLSVLINNEVIAFLQTGVVVSYETFEVKVKKITNDYIDQAQKTIDKQTKKNREDFKKQMTDKQKIRLKNYKVYLIEILDQLKLYQLQTIQAAYSNYQRIIKEF